MSRLQRHKNKQLVFNIVFILAVLALLMYFIFTEGIKLLLNTSIFVAKMTRPKKEAVKNTNDSFIPDVNIDTLPIATSSSRVVISGTAPSYKKLIFYINNINIKEVNLDRDDFSEEIGDLQTGKNEIYITAQQDDSNKEKQTPKYTLIYKKEKPTLEIKEPQDKTTVNREEIKIVGKTDKETMIKVNQLPVVVDAQGNFQTSIKLKEGENILTFEAQDIAGNIEKKELTVTFTKED